MSDIETPESVDGGFSLADIAGLDIGSVEEFRVVRLPAGVYDFEIKAAGLEEREDDDGDVVSINPFFELEVVECHAIMERLLAGSEITKESLIGKKHFERMRIPNPNLDREGAIKGLGRVKAFLKDAGLPSEGPLGGDGVTVGVLDEAIGHIIPKARIVNSPNPNDRSNPYKNIRLK